MSDDAKPDERAKKLVKAGVAVGIGSAAIVAALLYASKTKSRRAAGSRRTDAALAAVPFLEPHQLVIVAVGRVCGMQLGDERLGAGEIFARRLAKARQHFAEERSRIERLVGRDP